MLKKLKDFFTAHTYVSVILSAILTSASLIFVNYFIAWFALCFLFIALFNVSNIRQALYLGFVFGGVSAGILNYWMIPAIMQYAQSSIILAVFCLLLCSLVIGCIYAIQFLVFIKTRFTGTAFSALFGNALLMASVWVLFEWIRASIFAGMPWMSYSIGISQASNLILSQPAAVGGVFILSFLLVLINYTLSLSINKEAWKWMLAPAFILIIHFLIGTFLYNNISNQIGDTNNKELKAALVLASLDPETVWDANNGNALVKNLISLNSEAAESNTDLILWSETVIPWTYDVDDDFLKEIAKATSVKKTHFLLGMSTAVDHNSDAVYNSAYFFNPTGSVLDRYDKGELLSLIERPLFEENSSIILPFLAGSGLIVQRGIRQQAIQTPWGKAGVLLCNESTVPAITSRYVSNQVSFLINLGNDGWFSDFFITKQHFYNSRLRAIESRKDLVINSNRGISGVIRANGEVGAQYQSDLSSVQHVKIYPNQIAALSYHYFIYAVLSVTVALLILKIYTILPSRVVSNHHEGRHI
ncbi:apolipoprotein N-acyltransferase [Pontibacter sp. JH31]|uniref:Apolipoprotein N-acyltransferase n=1 Tax=Pontibacter aquaedesilientis TaxID=2766980 RepID=A0ABR7XKP9_9BACT|nr:apolipoprotein N-acyltransferase [Pontibacter aquaedesilientis]MBD1398872.1 apolipoprotein N-acyltransferase [Pontibacter aquaedesilientis]